MSLLHVERLGRRYGGLAALDDITLAVPAGARHAIIGPNGAGKSTLLGLVAGTVRPTAGRVRFDGRDITRLAPAARARRGIGRTWQHPAVFPRLSVADNVALAVPRTAHPSRVTEVLAQVGLADRAGTAAGHLPYGLQRLLEFAVVLAARPRLLLLDEPSAGLAAEEVARLTAAIRALPAEVTVVLVDHNLDLVWAVADTVTVLDRGRLLASGVTAEVRADPRVQRAYLNGTATAGTGVRAESSGRASSTLLRVRALRAGYHGAAVVDGLDLDVYAGEVLGVLGRNGAGKSTLLNAVAGLVAPWPPTRIELDGVRLDPGRGAHRVARAGVGLVPQGRRLFDLTVAEHLTAFGPVPRQAGTRRTWRVDEVLDLLPALRGRLHHHAGQLSGGEQQMLALARALLAHPRLLILDEPGEGLAPAVVDQLAAAVGAIAAEGLAVLVAEQNLELVLRVAHRVIVLDGGRVALTSTARDLAGDEPRLHGLLGVAAPPAAPPARSPTPMWTLSG